LPLQDVTLNLSTSTTDGTLNTSSLLFTSSNWDTARTVYVEGYGDGTNEGNRNYSIDVGISTTDDKYGNTGYVGAPSFTVFSCDNDGSNTITSCRRSGGFSTSEGGGTAEFWIITDSDRVATTTGSDDTGQSGWVLQPNTDYYLKSGSSPYTLKVFTTDSWGLFTFGSLTTAFTSSGADTFWTGFNSDWTTSSDNCGDWRFDTGYSGQYGSGDTTGSGSISDGVSSCVSSSGYEKRIICVQQ
jgi:hypothetical protein